MKFVLEIFIVIGCLTLVSCGNSSLPYQVPTSGTNNTSARSGLPFGSQSSNTFYSGPTGSPVVSNTSVPDAGLNFNSPASGVDLFGLSNTATVTDPQQCVARYNSYPRFSGNFQNALADLTTCLNKVMISQNPTLFQQYQTLQQNYYNSY